MECLTGFLLTLLKVIPFLKLIIHACTRRGLEPSSCALLHPRTNHNANVTPIPPTPIGKVPFCMHSHRAHLIVFRF